MKKTFLLLLAIICSHLLVNANSEVLKPININIVNAKGKPIKDGGNIAVLLSKEKEDIYLPNKLGVISLSDVTENDVIRMVVDQDVYSISFAELLNEIDDEIFIVLKGKRLYSDNHKINTLLKNGLRKATPQESLFTHNAVEIRELDKYTNIAEYMQGRIAGVTISGSSGAYSVQIRAPSSIHMGTAPLIIVDGADAGDFNTVVNTIGVHDVESITVDKTGLGYGMRGVNGVVIITTKSGARADILTN